MIPLNCRKTDTVALGQFFECRALGRTSAGFCLLGIREFRGALSARLGAPPSLRRSGADQVALSRKRIQGSLLRTCRHATSRRSRRQPRNRRVVNVEAGGNLADRLTAVPALDRLALLMRRQLRFAPHLHAACHPHHQPLIRPVYYSSIMGTAGSAPNRPKRPPSRSPRADHDVVRVAIARRGPRPGKRAAGSTCGRGDGPEGAVLRADAGR